jgi:hypothetical protein
MSAPDFFDHDSGITRHDGICAGANPGVSGAIAVRWSEQAGLDLIGQMGRGL